MFFKFSLTFGGNNRHPWYIDVSAACTVITNIVKEKADKLLSNLSFWSTAQ